MAVAVPAAYQTWVSSASSTTGLPEGVVAAQINLESGFNPHATSPTGAEGIAQIEPGTWAGLGVSGSPYDPTAALSGYEREMGQLLAQFHGNVRNALAAYNAGPGNLSAGYGYADSILRAAGAGSGASVSQAGAGASSGSGGLAGGLDGVSAPMAALAVLGGGVALLALALWAGGVSL